MQVFLSFVPNLLQAFFCFYDVIFRHKPILELHVKPCQDAEGQTSTSLQIILRNPLHTPIYLQDLTLHFKRRCLKFRNPALYTLSLPQTDIYEALFPDSLGYQSFLRGDEPLPAKKAMYLCIALPVLLPPEIINEPSLIITAEARLQEGYTLKTVLKEAVALSTWENRKRSPRHITSVNIWD